MSVYSIQAEFSKVDVKGKILAGVFAVINYHTGSKLKTISVGFTITQCGLHAIQDIANCIHCLVNRYLFSPLLTS